MDKGTLTRTILLVVALINQLLVMKGLTPINEQATAEFLAYTFTVSTSLWAWWKNNDVTQKAIERKKKIDKLEKK